MVDEGFRDDAVTGDPDIGPPIRTALQRDLRGCEGRVVVKPGGLEGLGLRNCRLETGGFLRVDVRDVDLCPEGFAKCRLDGDPAQSQRMGGRPGQADQRRGQGRDRGLAPAM